MLFKYKFIFFIIFIIIIIAIIIYFLICTYILSKIGNNTSKNILVDTITNAPNNTSGNTITNAPNDYYFSKYVPQISIFTKNTSFYSLFCFIKKNSFYLFCFLLISCIACLLWKFLEYYGYFTPPSNRYNSVIRALKRSSLMVRKSHYNDAFYYSDVESISGVNWNELFEICEAANIKKKGTYHIMRYQRDYLINHINILQENYELSNKSLPSKMLLVTCVFAVSSFLLFCINHELITVNIQN